MRFLPLPYICIIGFTFWMFNATYPTMSAWIALLMGGLGISSLYWVLNHDLLNRIERYSTILERKLEGDAQAHMLAIEKTPLNNIIRATNRLDSRRIAEINELSHERGVLATVFAQMSDGVIVTDRLGQVTLINTAALDLFGATEETALGSRVAEVVAHYQLIDLWKECVETVQEQNSVVDFGSNNLFLEVSMSPIKTDELVGFLLLFSNLTEVRRLETVRRDFISNISHELRTPLAGLNAIVETLQDGALDDRPAAERFLGRAENEIDVMTQMVEELLELSRIESGLVPFRFATTGLRPLISEAIERVKRQVDRKGVRVSAELDHTLPPVLIDEARIEQVLNNLLSNAIKFTPEGGTITLSAQPYSQSHILVSVSDTGIGIPARNLPRIFERFYKSEASRTSRGTGLGLAIAKHIIQGHNSTIWAESVEGKGSTFFFTLPCEESE